MSVGQSIRDLRKKCDMTQKDLADRLHVTYQAVSRWENGDVEPSIDTLKEMCKIFNCSINELLSLEEDNNKETIKVVEKVVIQEPKPILGICDCCKKAIYSNSDLFRIYKKTNSLTRSNATNPNIYCKKCNEVRIKEEKREKERKRNLAVFNLKRKRKNAIVGGVVTYIFFLSLFLTCLSIKEPYSGIFYLVVGVFVASYISSMFLGNTFVYRLFVDAASLGVCKMPGIIFSFSLSGFLFLIFAKLFFAFLSYAIWLGLMILTIIITLPFSIIACPLGFIRNVSATNRLISSVY